MKRFLRFVALPAAIVVFACKMWAGIEDGRVEDVDTRAESPAKIISKYLEAARESQGVLRSASMEVEIEASVPKLKQQGRLHALRCISQVGVITYRAIIFQGDNTVKSQVIARYLEADRQAQANQNLAIAPSNYKFRFMGKLAKAYGRPVYVFEVTPRRKTVGLFKGEIWIDAATYLPAYEKGHFVKNPSIFFKRVEFERAYSVGIGLPVHTASVIQTRLVGKVELNVSYSHFAPILAQADAPSALSVEGVDPGQPSLSAHVSSDPYTPRE